MSKRKMVKSVEKSKVGPRGWSICHSIEGGPAVKSQNPISQLTAARHPSFSGIPHLWLLQALALICVYPTQTLKHGKILN